MAPQANTVATVGLLCGGLDAGPIIDWMGGGRFLIVGSVLLGLITYLLFSQLATHPGWLLPLYTLAGLAASVIVAVPCVSYFCIDSHNSLRISPPVQRVFRPAPGGSSHKWMGKVLNQRTLLRGLCRLACASP